MVCCGCTWFYCLPGCDGHCLNPLGSFGDAAVSSEPVTSLTAHSLMDHLLCGCRIGPHRFLQGSTLPPPAPLPQLFQLKSVCVETHGLRSPSRIASPFCSLSTCGSHTVLTSQTFYQLLNRIFYGMILMMNLSHLLLSPVMTRSFTGEGKFLMERLVLLLYVNKLGYSKHTQTSLLLNLLLYMPLW